MKEVEDIERRDLWMLIFLFIIQNPSYLGELKNYIGGGF